MNFKKIFVLLFLIGAVSTGYAADNDYISFERKISKVRIDIQKKVAKELISGDNELWELYRCIVIEDARIEKSTQHAIIVNRLALINEYRSDAVGPKDLRDRLRNAFLVVVMEPLVANARKQILQVLATIDEYIAYWQYQKIHPVSYFFHKSPTKWVNGVSQQKEVESHLKRLKANQDKHYKLLGELSHHIDSFDHTGTATNQYLWVANLLSLLNKTMCEGDNQQIEGKDIATYQQLLPLAKDIFNGVHNYAQKAERRSFAKDKKPGLLERNWFTAAIAGGFTAAGSIIAFYNRVQLTGWGSSLADNVKRYGYEYPKEQIKETFLMDEKKANNEFINNINKELNKIKRATSPRDYQQEAINKAGGLEEFNKLNETQKKELVVAQENAHRTIVLDNLKQDYIKILTHEDYAGVIKITPDSTQPEVKQDATADDIKNYAEYFITVDSGKTGEAIDFIQQAISKKVDEIGKYTGMADNSDLIEKYLKETVTNKYLGVDNKNLAEVNKVLTQLIKVVPQAVDLVPLTKLLLEGKALQTSSLQEPIVNIIEHVAKEFDAVVENIVKPVRGVAALVVALPVLATVIGGAYGSYKLYGSLKHKPNYKKMRATLIDINHLLNLYDQEATKDMHAADYGNLLYLVNKLKSEEKELPAALRERFQNSIQKLEKPIPMRNKIRIVDLMMHEFLNPVA